MKSPALVANCLTKSTNNNNTNKTNPAVNAINSISKSPNTNSISSSTYNGDSSTNTENVVDDHIRTLKPNSHGSLNEDVPETTKTLDNIEHSYAFQDDEDSSFDVLREDNYPVEGYEDEAIYNGEDDDDRDDYGGGIRERSLLCPILEEDGESTASTSSLIATSLLTSLSRVSHLRYGKNIKNLDNLS